ncbi:MAG TPA: hypothetical protein VFR58_16785 [Flavisolibacter sp.]|nr:hypothetical protein [Flavisolibacter sp.]
MNRLPFISLFLVLLLSCSSKKKKTPKDSAHYFPVLPFLMSQAQQIDSAMYGFILIRTQGNRRDTMDISREDARRYANDFISIPDLRDSKHGSDYAELSTFDSVVGKVLISYTAEEQGLELNRQDVTIVPGFGQEDRIETVYLEKIIEDDDSTVEKKMLWETGKYFQIRTIVQKKNTPDRVENLKVAWKSF